MSDSRSGKLGMLSEDDDDDDSPIYWNYLINSNVHVFSFEKIEGSSAKTA